MADRPLIAITSCGKPAYLARRRKQAETWVPLAIAAGYDVETFDGPRLGVSDDYAGLPMKTKALCDWARGKYKKMLKVDDDSYIDVSRLEVPDADYAGCLLAACDTHTVHPPPVPNAPKGMYSAPYASGGGYWVSDRAMSIVAGAAITEDWAEDRWVGNVLAAVGIAPTALSGYGWLKSADSSLWPVVSRPFTIMFNVDRPYGDMLAVHASVRGLK